MKKNIKNIIFRDYDFRNMFDYHKQCFLYPEKKIVCIYRKTIYSLTSKNVLKRIYWQFRWLIVRHRKKAQISLNATIGEGFRLLHDGPRVIVSKAKIGNDCTVGINVIIGYGEKNGIMGAPKIGDRVYIGHNTSIIGDIHIGNDVLIAPNSFVNRNIPSHSLVIGNNIIIPKENASAQFLKIGG